MHSFALTGLLILLLALVGLTAADKQTFTDVIGTGEKVYDLRQVQSSDSGPRLRKRMDPDPRDWERFNRFIRGPDPSLQPAIDRSILRQRYEHLVHHNGMPVFAAESATDSREARLMKQAWADFGALQVYGSPRVASRGAFQAHSLLKSENSYTYHRMANQEEFLRELNYYHQLEAKYGPNLKNVLMGLPLDTRGMGRFGGHSANRVWAAPKGKLSDYDVGSLRHKLNRDRFGLFMSRDGESLLAITVGNNGVAQIEERLNEAAPMFVAGSRRF